MCGVQSWCVELTQPQRQDEMWETLIPLHLLREVESCAHLNEVQLISYLPSVPVCVRQLAEMKGSSYAALSLGRVCECVCVCVV